MFLNSVAGRHPRYTISCIVGLLVLILILAKDNGPSIFVSWPTPRRNGGSVSTRLAQAELEWAIAVAQREVFMNDLGQSQKFIKPWPSLEDKDHMYTLWDFFLPTFRCPHRVKRVGTMGDGGKWVCGLERVAAKRPSCVVYSIGVNGESSFEAALLKETNCQVWGYDFSVKEFGPEIEKDAALKPRTHFFSYALGGEDNYGPNADPRTYTLHTLMKMNGHNFIDILKIDIEGAEFEVLQHIVKAYQGRPLPFGQLQLEIHAWEKDFREFERWWKLLEEAGLRAFWTEPNLVYLNLFRGSTPDLAEYSFINIRGGHAIISDD